jgi:pimeloyl-ACP methyl ester carboxylesterase
LFIGAGVPSLDHWAAVLRRLPRERRNHVERALVNGITLEYEDSGTDGEPVVCIHGAFIADSFRPLVAEPSLVSRYRLITYHRRGYVGSSRTPGPISVAQQAADCLALLHHLGVERAHVVGHSFGGCVALQLALDAPEAVHSLALLEPALMVGESAESYRESQMRSAQRYREVGAEVVVDEALRARWPEYHVDLEQMLPGAFAQAVADAPATLELDIGYVDWHFGETEARRITQPVLCVLGSESEALWPRFGETHRLLLAWLPRAEAFVLPGATHFLQVQNPRDMAKALATFYARHPCDPLAARI